MLYRIFIFCFIISCSLNQLVAQITLNESMGTVSSTTPISTHQNNNGFAQDQWSYSGEADVRSTSGSPGGGANIFITNSPNRSFRLDGLSGTGCSNLTLQFWIWKNGGAGNPLTISEFYVQTSSDGSNFDDLDWGGHNLGAAWIQTGLITIPTNTIAIRFIQPVVPDQQVRIDDVTIVGSGPCENPLLPVNFTHLIAKTISKEVLVQFGTASEINNDYFTIERSSDGIHFSELDRIKGQGNSGWLTEYEYLDHSPFAGHNFYRIKQTDYDGKSAYSQVVKASTRNFDHAVEVYSNGQKLSMNSPEEIHSVTLFDMNGAQIFHKNVNTYHLEINQAVSTPGLYIVMVKTSGQTYQKLVWMM